MRQRSNKNLKMKKWMKVHAVFVTFLLVFYAAVGFFGGLGIIGNDMKQKIALGATTIGVMIDSLPAKPILSATTSCAENVSIVNLAWKQSDGATSYAVSRDGNMLASGFQTMAYDDSTVFFGNDYSYTVTASGFSGDVVSDPVMVSAQDCAGSSLPDPVVTLVSFDNREVSRGAKLSTTNTKFRITGTTNMPNADIKISTLPGPIFVSTLQANSNGYWHYRLPRDLGAGKYTFRIVATDPNEPSRDVTRNYSFEISKKTDATGAAVNDINQLKDDHSASATPEEIGWFPVSESIGNILIFIGNKNGKVYGGQDIQFEVLFNHFGKSLQDSNANTVDMRYEILDSKGVSVFSEDANERISGGRLKKSIHVSEELPFGNYKIRVSLLQEEHVLSAEGAFVFAQMPVVNFGGGYEFSYSQILSQIGSLLVVSVTFLLFFVFMFILEFYFFKKSIFVVTEKDLSGRGLISSGKEVSP